MKETLISNVISNLVDKIGVKNSNIVREVLVLEMKDIEIKEKERQLEYLKKDKKKMADKLLEYELEEILSEYEDIIEK